MRKRSRIKPDAEVKVFSFSRAGGTGSRLLLSVGKEKEETFPTILKKHENSILRRPKETLDKKRTFILTYFLDRILNSAILARFNFVLTKTMTKATNGY